MVTVVFTNPVVISYFFNFFDFLALDLLVSVVSPLDLLLLVAISLIFLSLAVLSSLVFLSLTSASADFLLLSFELSLAAAAL
ncbi:hypothetical protein BCR42DRAFT_112861 [Absidia repens]|uniref:Uncharacterized protein n=1 Tax=Absidia repens TaxID=90262 RepID=A0A1X2I679_9FUNG|nr:hypothetical protein BCR42DRAFT_112861 [Absidia repens]